MLGKSFTILAVTVLGLMACTHSELNSPESANSDYNRNVATVPATTDKGQCVGKGRASADNACYKIKTHAQCLDETDKASCQWVAE